jgi:hypothetical protein
VKACQSISIPAADNLGSAYSRAGTRLLRVRSDRAFVASDVLVVADCLFAVRKTQLLQEAPGAWPNLARLAAELITQKCGAKLSTNTQEYRGVTGNVSPTHGTILLLTLACAFCRAPWKMRRKWPSPFVRAGRIQGMSCSCASHCYIETGHLQRTA